MEPSAGQTDGKDIAEKQNPPTTPRLLCLSHLSAISLSLSPSLPRRKGRTHKDTLCEDTLAYSLPPLHAHTHHTQACTAHTLALIRKA